MMTIKEWYDTVWLPQNQQWMAQNTIPEYIKQTIDAGGTTFDTDIANPAYQQAFSDFQGNLINNSGFSMDQIRATPGLENFGWVGGGHGGPLGAWKAGPWQGKAISLGALAAMGGIGAGAAGYGPLATGGVGTIEGGATGAGALGLSGAAGGTVPAVAGAPAALDAGMLGYTAAAGGAGAPAAASALGYGAGGIGLANTAASLGGNIPGGSTPPESKGLLSSLTSPMGLATLGTVAGAGLNAYGQTKAMDTYKDVADQIRADQAPYNAAGQAQLDTLSNYQLPQYDPFTWEKYGNSERLAYLQNEMRKAVEGSAAARGGLFSGATGKRLQENAMNVASTEYEKALANYMAQYNTGLNTAQMGFQNKFGLANLGQNAASMQGNALTNMGQQVGATQQGLYGNLGNTLTGLGNDYMNYSLYQQIQDENNRRNQQWMELYKNRAP